MFENGCYLRRQKRFKDDKREAVRAAHRATQQDQHRSISSTSGGSSAGSSSSLNGIGLGKESRNSSKLHLNSNNSTTPPISLNTHGHHDPDDSNGGGNGGIYQAHQQHHPHHGGLSNQNIKSDLHSRHDLTNEQQQLHHRSMYGHHLIKHQHHLQEGSSPDNIDKLEMLTNVGLGGVPDYLSGNGLGLHGSSVHHHYSKNQLVDESGQLPSVLKTYEQMAQFAHMKSSDGSAYSIDSILNPKTEGPPRFYQPYPYGISSAFPNNSVAQDSYFNPTALYHHHHLPTNT